MTLVSYPWMLDLLVGVILLACACIKGVKGIYKSLMPLAVIVASVICATFLSAILTEPVTEMVYPIAEDKLISALKIDKLPQEDLQQFANLVTNPDTLAKKIEEMPNTTLIQQKNTSNGSNINSNSGLIPLQRTDADVILGYAAKVTAQFDALRVADFSPKKFTVLNSVLHSSPSHLRNKARIRNF